MHSTRYDSSKDIKTVYPGTVFLWAVNIYFVVVVSVLVYSFSYVNRQSVIVLFDFLILRINFSSGP